jgi:putative phage-type endonuclease
MNREQWLEARKAGITGTGAAAIMGASPYQNSVDYWLEKTGQREPDDVDNEFARYGFAAESHLIELFRLDYPQFDVVHNDFDMRRNPEYPWMLGSLDGELTDRSTGEKGILEIKTAHIMSAAQIGNWHGGIPMQHFWQVLHYLLATGFSFAVVKAQLKFEFEPGAVRLDTRHYRFTREEVQPQMDMLRKKEIEFWRHVTDRTRPPLTLPRI